MTNTLSVTLSQVPNWELLDQQLLSAMPTTYNGGNHNQGSLSITATFNADPVSAADIATTQAVCAAHIPTQKTAQQIANATADTRITALMAAVDAEINHFKAGAFTAANIPNLASAQIELVRLANDVADLAVLLKRRLM